MNIFLASDHHFFHENVIKYCDRPFKSFEEMNDELIKRHNSIVKEQDLSIFLGDFSCNLQGRKDELKEILKSMNGQKILIRGNHDHMTNKEYLSLGFNAVYGYLEIGEYFLCHYPLEESKWTTKPERKLIDIFKNSKCKKNHSRTYSSKKF